MRCYFLQHFVEHVVAEHIVSGKKWSCDIALRHCSNLTDFIYVFGFNVQLTIVPYSEAKNKMLR